MCLKNGILTKLLTKNRFILKEWWRIFEKMSRKLMKFLILFDNSNLLFFPGQFLSGRVILEVDDDMPVLGESQIFLP